MYLLVTLDRLLLINDLINNVLNRYQAIKSGDWAKAQEIDATLVYRAVYKHTVNRG
jgi:hypothetical protein